MTQGQAAAFHCAAMCDTIDTVAGVFLDATSGMERLVEDLRARAVRFARSLPERPNATDLFLDQPLTYRGIAEGSEGPIHFTTNREYLQRNSIGGDNWRLSRISAWLRSTNTGKTTIERRQQTRSESPRTISA